MKKWSLEELKNIALKYNTRSDFQNNDKGAYLSALRKKILDNICKHMKILQKTWSLEELKQEALKYKHRGEFATNSVAAYSYAHSHNILDIICDHMNPIRETWTHEEVIKVASLCLNKSEFQKKYRGAYKYAIKNNLIPIISIRMKNKVIKWSNEDIKKMALLCYSRREFEAKFLGAYKAALRGKIIDEVCQHMKDSHIESAPEKELFNLVKYKFPSTKKFRKRKIEITNKPWIFGFDIDIFVPELNKGIEFDGTYWHSLYRLKKSRIKWPEEDIKNYHQIKDDYFKSENIEILHVKEEDWLKNKEKCINECFMFLS